MIFCLLTDKNKIDLTSIRTPLTKYICQIWVCQFILFLKVMGISISKSIKNISDSLHSYSC